MLLIKLCLVLLRLSLAELDAPVSVDSVNASGRWKMNGREEMIAVMMILVLHLCRRCDGLLLRCRSSSSSSFIVLSPFSSFFLTSSFVFLSPFCFVVVVSLLMSSFLLSLLPSSFLMSCGCHRLCRGCLFSSYSSFVVLVVCPLSSLLSLLLRCL